MKIRALAAEDRDDVREALTACGAFSDEEVRVAMEMVDAGMQGDYELPAVELDGKIRAYACIGKAALTASAWYVYWLCVHPSAQRVGAGQCLQGYIEQFVFNAGGDRLVVETSGRPDYARARRFYMQAGFSEVGRIPDFYKLDDDCVIFFKKLAPRECE